MCLMHLEPTDGSLALHHVSSAILPVVHAWNVSSFLITRPSRYSPQGISAILAVTLLYRRCMHVRSQYLASRRSNASPKIGLASFALEIYKGL